MSFYQKEGALCQDIFYDSFRFFGNLNRGSAYAQGYGGTSYTDAPPSREATARRARMDAKMQIEKKIIRANWCDSRAALVFLSYSKVERVVPRHAVAVRRRLNRLTTIPETFRADMPAPSATSSASPSAASAEATARQERSRSKL